MLHYCRMVSLAKSCDNFPTSLVMVNNKKDVVGHSKLSLIPSIQDACFVESGKGHKRQRQMEQGSRSAVRRQVATQQRNAGGAARTGPPQLQLRHCCCMSKSDSEQRDCYPSSNLVALFSTKNFNLYIDIFYLDHASFLLQNKTVLLTLKFCQLSIKNVLYKKYTFYLNMKLRFE